MHFKVGPLVISGAAIDRVRARFVSFTSRLTMETLRPLPLFLGVTGPNLCISADAFSPPFTFKRQTDKSSLEKFLSRLSRNLNFFATNYVFVALCTVLVVALMHPRMLLYVGITWGAWWLHTITVRQDLRLVVMEKDLNEVLTPKRRSWVLTAWTIWVAIAHCVRPSMKGLAISGGLILFHAIMRDPSKLAGDIVKTRSLSGAGAGSDSDGSEVMVDKADAAV